MMAAPSPTPQVPRPSFVAARRWATRHPCDCTRNRCGQTILVPYEDAGVV